MGDVQVYKSGRCGSNVTESDTLYSKRSGLSHVARAHRICIIGQSESTQLRKREVSKTFTVTPSQLISFDLAGFLEWCRAGEKGVVGVIAIGTRLYIFMTS